MNKDFYNIKVSRYGSATSVNSSETLISSELKNILSGTYKNEILECRRHLNNGNKIKYKNAKAQLPAVTFSGRFNGSHKKENLIEYSNFIIIDIDSIEPDRLRIIKSTIFSDIHVNAVWISPSAAGLKVLIKVSNEHTEHKLCFDTLSKYFLSNYQIEIDKSGSDVCRLCFVSFDEDILVKESSTIFDFREYFVVDNSIDEYKKDKEKISKVYISKQLQSESNIFKSTENRNLQGNRDAIIKIIKFLKKNKRSITDNYNDWFRIACAIANSFTFDLGEKYYLELCRLDGELHDEYKSKYLLEYCYRNRRIGLVEFSTIVYLANKKGFKPIK